MKLFRFLVSSFALLFIAHVSIFASSGGIVGVVQAGCTCHGSASGGTSLSIPGRSGGITVKAGETLSLSLMVAHSSQSRAGMNLAVRNAAGANAGTLQAGNGSQLISGELTHSSPQGFSGGSASFPFQWTAPTTPGTYTLSAVGNAVNGDGGTGGDAWNSLTPITITVEPPAPAGFTLSGRILNTSGAAVAGVNVNLTGNNQNFSATTDAQGNYSIANVPNGAYILTPSLLNWVFEPATLSVTVNGANVTAPTITGRRFWTITGTILNPSGGAVVGAIVHAYLGTGTTISSSATTDVQGNYTLTVLNGSYSVRAFQTNWVFEPSAINVAVNGANVAGQNFTGRRLWAITGTILNPSGGAVAGAIVNAYNGAVISSSATTDAQGNYTLVVLNGSYSVRAFQTNWVFEPSAINVTVNGANVAGQNITGRRLWAVSGNISNPTGEAVANVSISAANGTLTASTATTDAQGNYTLWLLNGSYTITPSRTNWAFLPTTLTATVAGANLNLDRITGRLLMSVRDFANEIAVQTAPNPASEQIIVSYTLSSPQRTRIEVFSITGERVRSLYEAASSGGKQTSTIDVRELPTGMYFVRIQAGTELLKSAPILVRKQ